MCTVKLITVKHTFSAITCRAYISAGVAADTFTQFFLEESKFLFRTHSFDLFYFCKTVCILRLFGLSDQFIVNLMFFSFAHMTSLQQCICVRTCFFPVNRLNSQCVGIIRNLCTFYFPDSFDSQGSDFFDIQLSFTSDTDNISFLSVHTVLFDQLVKTICIAWFQTNHCPSFHLGSFNHIFT